MRRIVVFTDLDGTLLDARTYSFDAARAALGALRARRIPLVICSSKTRAEIEHYRAKLENVDPFITENGGAVFVPRGYFPMDSGSPLTYNGEGEGPYRILRLGARYEDLRRAMEQLRREGFDVRGFGDMTASEIAQTTGLSPDEAVMAGKREFDEPFLFNGPVAQRESLIRSVVEKGFKITQGLFYHILGASDKGRAVSLVTEMFRREYGEILTSALGDSPNDLPMLRCVDRPFVVEKHAGGHDPALAAEGFTRVRGPGPEGWNRAVIDLLEEICR